MINSKSFLLATVVFCAFYGVMSKAKTQQQIPLREWFNQLKSPIGELCCHNFDGQSLDEAEWRNAGGKYQARVDGKWIDIPDTAVASEPNRLGRAHLWLRGDGSVRCFIPGVMM